MSYFFNLGFEVIKNRYYKDDKANNLENETKNDLNWGISISFNIFYIRKRYFFSNMKKLGLRSFIFITLFLKK